jgi:hypothetical protein
MKNLLSILGIIAILIFAFSFTESGIMTTKPAKPVSTVVVRGMSTEIGDSIIKYANQGYQVQANVSNGSSSYCVVVMVKY